MSSKYEAVQQFYDKMGFQRAAHPSTITSNRRNQLIMYIISEVVEFGDSVDLVDQVDAATDLLYFVMDIFVEMGVDPEVPFHIVNDANMNKLWDDGKPHFDYMKVPPRLLRPEHWEPPEGAIKTWLETIIKGDN